MSEPIRDRRNLMRDALGPTPECPPLDLLAAAEPAESLKRHLSECPYCTAELGLLHQFESAQSKPAEAADLSWIEAELGRRSPVAAPRREPLGKIILGWFEALLSPAGRGRFALAMATLLVLVTAGVFLQPGTGVRPPSEDGAVWRSGQLVALSPIGDLDQAPAQLRWESAPGAAAYRVHLFEVDGTEIWSADSTVTTVDVPGTLAPKLSPGRAFEWSVEARDAAGRKIAATNLQTFHILATRR